MAHIPCWLSQSYQSSRITLSNVSVLNKGIYISYGAICIFSFSTHYLISSTVPNKSNILQVKTSLRTDESPLTPLLSKMPLV